MEQISTGTKVAEYSATEAALAELAKRYKGATYDVATKEGMTSARKARAELRGLRVALEAKRVEIKAPVLLQARLIDSEAQRITRELVAMENPIDDQIKGGEARQEAERVAREKAEAERMAAIQKRIADMERLPVSVGIATAAQVEEALQAHLRNDPRAWAREQLPAAQVVHADVEVRLRSMHAAAVAAEAEAARQAQERERLAAEEKRLADERAKLEAEDRERRRKLAEEEAAAQARIRAAEEQARREREDADRKSKEARDAEEARLKAERDHVDGLRRAAEEQQHQARLAAEREAEEKARAERERQEAEQRAKDEAARKEREAREAQERARLAEEHERMDARAALESFVDRFGHLPEFDFVVVAIRSYLEKKAA